MTAFTLQLCSALRPGDEGSRGNGRTQDDGRQRGRDFTWSSLEKKNISWMQGGQGLSSMAAVKVVSLFCSLLSFSLTVVLLGHFGRRYFSNVGSVVWILLPISSSAAVEQGLDL